MRPAFPLHSLKPRVLQSHHHHICPHCIYIVTAPRPETSHSISPAFVAPYTGPALRARCFSRGFSPPCDSSLASLAPTQASTPPSRPQSARRTSVAHVAQLHIRTQPNDRSRIAIMNHGYPPPRVMGGPPAGPTQRLNELLDNIRTEFETESQRSVDYEGQSE
jgi:hypothetical protein